MSSEFEKLAAELEVLAKAQPVTEEDKVLAAAKEAGVDTDQVGDADDTNPDADADADGDHGPDGDGDEDDEVLGKSFQVVGADGAPVKAYDATDLIKSLNDRIGGLESEKAEDAERREHLGKSLESIADLLKAQSEQIDTLQKAMVNMNKQGVGRKAVLTVNEKPDTTMAKSVQSDGLDGKEFMAKAMGALKSGRISAMDVSIAEGSLNRGIPIREDIVSRVMGNQ